MNKRSQSGQALLLVLLTVAVLLTVSLSVVSQSVSDIAVTTKEEESLRAFSAAEAGVEEALVSEITSLPDTPQTVSTETGAQEVTYTIESEGFPNANEYVYPEELETNDSATIWLVPHNPDDTLDTTKKFTRPRFTVHWSKTDEDVVAEVSVWYLADGGGIGVAKLILAPNYFGDTAYGNQAGEFFKGDVVFPVSVNKHPLTYDNTVYNFMFSKEITRVSPTSDLANAGLTQSERDNLLLIKVRLYLNDNPQPIAISAPGGPPAFPAQGQRIESTGEAGESQRRIRIFELYPDAPSFFDSAITSRGDLVK